MLSIITSIALGVLVGRFSGYNFQYLGELVQVGLCMLIFFVGFDMGRSENLLRVFRRMGSEAIVVPLLTIIGSVVGGTLVGLVFGYTWNEGAALGSGMGWYSLSGVMLEPYSKELSAISFMSNVFREVLSILIIPFVASKCGWLTSVSLPGAGAMDTLIPIISKATDQKTTIIAFFTGTILSISIPILVQFFISL